ncbi:hypothetical protein [Desulfonatronum thioautotrophicum]|uniref:hypothetical protein n=1 Tax=Desulfonatronum thioautotrophicum TaxID=617001 RepID=UPI0012947B7F|nr:hypothetical protein [Desulfonatronum thioautotrophicum]
MRFFKQITSPLSFPTFWPLLALDRILIAPHQRLMEMHVHKSRLARGRLGPLSRCCQDQIGLSKVPPSNAAGPPKNLAYALLQTNDARQDVKWSKRARAIASENITFIKTHALILIELGKAPEAEDLLEKALLRLSQDDLLRPAVQKLANELAASRPASSR